MGATVDDMTAARIIRVRIETGREGLLYATSPNLRGLLVAEPTRAELLRAIPQAIADLYEAIGERVLVTEAANEEADGLHPWVAFPVETARRALARLEATH